MTTSFEQSQDNPSERVPTPTPQTGIHEEQSQILGAPKLNRSLKDTGSDDEDDEERGIQQNYSMAIDHIKPVAPIDSIVRNEVNSQTFDDKDDQEDEEPIQKIYDTPMVSFDINNLSTRMDEKEEPAGQVSHDETQGEQDDTASPRGIAPSPAMGQARDYVGVAEGLQPSLLRSEEVDDELIQDLGGAKLSYADNASQEDTSKPKIGEVHDFIDDDTKPGENEDQATASPGADSKDAAETKKVKPLTKKQLQEMKRETERLKRNAVPELKPEIKKSNLMNFIEQFKNKPTIVEEKSVDAKPNVIAPRPSKIKKSIFTAEIVEFEIAPPLPPKAKKFTDWMSEMKERGRHRVSAKDLRAREEASKKAKQPVQEEWDSHDEMEAQDGEEMISEYDSDDEYAQEAVNKPKKNAYISAEAEEASMEEGSDAGSEYAGTIQEDDETVTPETLSDGEGHEQNAVDEDGDRSASGRLNLPDEDMSQNDIPAVSSYISKRSRIFDSDDDLDNGPDKIVKFDSSDVVEPVKQIDESNPKQTEGMFDTRLAELFTQPADDHATDAVDMATDWDKLRSLPAELKPVEEYFKSQRVSFEGDDIRSDNEDREVTIRSNETKKEGGQVVDQGGEEVSDEGGEEDGEDDDADQSEDADDEMEDSELIAQTEVEAANKPLHSIFLPMHERLALEEANKPILKVDTRARNKYIETEADVEEDEFMNAGGEDGEGADADKMEAMSGDEDEINDFEDIEAHHRESMAAKDAAGITELVNDLAEPGGLMRKHRERRKALGDRYGTELDDWDSDDEFHYWRNKRQGRRLQYGINSGDYTQDPSTFAFARALRGGDDDHEADEQFPSAVTPLSGGLARQQWIQMMEKENSNGGYRDEESISFLETYSGQQETTTISVAKKVLEPRGGFAKHASAFGAFLSERKNVVLPEENDRRAVNRKGMVFKKSER